MSRFFSRDDYPDYYKAVNIEYFDERTLGRYYGRAWIAWDDDNGYTWTFDGTNRGVSDIEVLDWWD